MKKIILNETDIQLTLHFTHLKTGPNRYFMTWIGILWPEISCHTFIRCNFSDWTTFSTFRLRTIWKMVDVCPDTAIQQWLQRSEIVAKCFQVTFHVCQLMICDIDWFVHNDPFHILRTRRLSQWSFISHEEHGTFWKEVLDGEIQNWVDDAFGVFWKEVLDGEIQNWVDDAFGVFTSLEQICHFFQLDIFVRMFEVCSLNENGESSDTIRRPNCFTPVGVELRIEMVQLDFSRESNGINRVFRSSLVVISVMNHNVIKSVIVTEWSSKHNDPRIWIQRWIHLKNDSSPSVLYRSIDLGSPNGLRQWQMSG